jgi:hypothetical protein
VAKKKSSRQQDIHMETKCVEKVPNPKNFKVVKYVKIIKNLSRPSSIGRQLEKNNPTKGNSRKNAKPKSE